MDELQVTEYKDIREHSGVRPYEDNMNKIYSIVR